MIHKWRLEGNRLIKQRGGLGNLDPFEVARYYHELRTDNHKFPHSKKKRSKLLRHVAYVFGINVPTVKWCYQAARTERAGCACKAPRRKQTA
jgi:hypothetical protein